MQSLRDDVRAQRQAQAARGQTCESSALRVRPVRQGLLPQGAPQGPRDLEAFEAVSVHL